MNPLKISAQFAAFLWYAKRSAQNCPERANAFAQINWPRFLPVAHRGLGRLLRRIAGPPSHPLPEARFHPKLASLTTVAAALRTQSWPQAK